MNLSKQAYINQFVWRRVPKRTAWNVDLCYVPWTFWNHWNPLKEFPLKILTLAQFLTWGNLTPEIVLVKINEKFISVFNLSEPKSQIAIRFPSQLFTFFLCSFFRIFNEFLSKARFLRKHNYFHFMRKKQQSIWDWFIKFHYFLRLLHFCFSFFWLLFLCLWLFLLWDFSFRFQRFCVCSRKEKL